MCLGYINPLLSMQKKCKKKKKTLFKNRVETFNSLFFNLLLDRQERRRLLTSIVSLASDLFATPLSCMIKDHLQPLKRYFNLEFLTPLLLPYRSRLSGETAPKIERAQAVFLGVMF